MYNIWWLCLSWCSRWLIILVMLLLIFVLILLKISVGVGFVVLVIIVSVRLICVSLLFDVIFVSGCSGMFGCLVMWNLICLSLCGLLLVSGMSVILKFLFVIDNFCMLVVMVVLSVFVVCVCVFDRCLVLVR